jgi:nitrate reductase gamma subunit
MTEFARYLDQLLLGALPFVALVLFLIGTIYRYRMQSFTYSSLSSQFLENRQHFWAMVPFHYGILVVLAGHLVAFMVPRSVLAWNSKPLRLYILEGSALAFGIMTLVGLLAILLRRGSSRKLRVVTSKADLVLYFLLVVQVASGVYVALFHPWGSSWFASSAAPYLKSLLKLSPEVGWIAAMPFAVKLHIVNAWLLIAFFPFTRLVHVLVVPNQYLLRKRQVVRWNRDPKTARLIQ